MEDPVSASTLKLSENAKSVLIFKLPRIWKSWVAGVEASSEVERGVPQRSQWTGTTSQHPPDCATAAPAHAAPDPPAERSRRIPGPPALPLLGHLPHFLWHGDLADMLASFSSAYGPVSCATLRGRPIVFVSDPLLAREVATVA